MQMAMVSLSQKPTQRMRNGEHSEGLPGSTIRAWHVLRETSRTWETRKVPEITSVSGYPPLVKQVSRPKGQVGKPMVFRESDQSIVLRDGRAVHTGKGLTEVRSL